MHQWVAEVEVDERLVRDLLEEQFPELAAAPARLLAEGWDNAVWLVDERWAFRFPRRGIAIPGVEREIAVLPLLAPALPVRVPVPAFVGRASGRFPWPFFGAAVLDGREPDATAPAEAERAGLAAAIGAFLRALHAPEVAAAADGGLRLPVDVNRRADMDARVPRTREWLEQLEALGLWRHQPAAERVLAEASELPPPEPEPATVVHGDLHFRHVLVDGSRLVAVIDWGDVCRADPAVDLQLYWSFLPPAARPELLRAYGPVAEERLLRARVLALCLCAALAAYGRDRGFAGVEREALDGLARTLVD